MLEEMKLNGPEFENRPSGSPSSSTFDQGVAAAPVMADEIHVVSDPVSVATPIESPVQRSARDTGSPIPPSATEPVYQEASPSASTVNTDSIASYPRAAFIAPRPLSIYTPTFYPPTLYPPTCHPPMSHPPTSSPTPLLALPVVTSFGNNRFVLDVLHIERGIDEGTLLQKLRTHKLNALPQARRLFELFVQALGLRRLIVDVVEAISVSTIPLFPFRPRSVETHC